MSAPRCPQHNIALRCPACTGSEGGKTITPARTLASRANAQKARAARMRRYAASLEGKAGEGVPDDTLEWRARIWGGIQRPGYVIALDEVRPDGTWDCAYTTDDGRIYAFRSPGHSTTFTLNAEYATLAAALRDLKD